MRPFEIVEKKWRIAKDDHSFVLQKYGGIRKKTGEERWNAEGWYVKLEHVLEALLRNQILESEEDLPTAIKDAVGLVRSLKDELGRAFVFEIPDPQQSDPEKTLILNL